MTEHSQLDVARPTDPSTCAICEGEFIDHRHGALGHDWMPKVPPVELTDTDVAIAQTAATARGEIG
jgi:hypothetical protein